MKPLLLLLLVIPFIIGCQKERSQRSENFESNIRLALKDSLLLGDFAQLDFSRALQFKVDSVRMNILRVPFKGKKLANDFVLIAADEQGLMKLGKIIHLTGSITDSEKGKQSAKSWNGAVQISSLDRRTSVTSPVVNGYILALHTQANAKTALVAPSGVLPEVVITYTLPSDGGQVSWTSWISIQSFLLDYGGPIWNNYYVPMDGGGSPSYGGAYSGSGSLQPEPPLMIDIESQDDFAGLDLEKFIYCFTAIPDEGAKCSIEIATDIPVDNNPYAFYDFSTKSPGHTFITIRKSNGTQHAVQNIGFYPRSGYKASTLAPTAGKLVDNSYHEFNASLVMPLSPAQLSVVLVRMQQLSNLNYDTDEYNCTDWALDIFNRVRMNPLEIPLYGIPGSPLTQNTRTPQGVYHKLQQMMNANDPEKGNITIGIYKGYAGNSTGPCN